MFCWVLRTLALRFSMPYQTLVINCNYRRPGKISYATCSLGSAGSLTSKTSKLIVCYKISGKNSYLTLLMLKTRKRHSF
jgi:hypothetical protein